MGGGRLPARGHHDVLLRHAEGAEALDLGGPEGPRLADGGRPALRLVDLVANGEVAGEQPEADGDLVGMQAIADEMVEVVAVVQLFDRLLGAPAASVEGGEALRADRAQVGDVDPRAALVLAEDRVVPSCSPRGRAGSVLYYMARRVNHDPYPGPVDRNAESPAGRASRSSTCVES